MSGGLLIFLLCFAYFIIESAACGIWCWAQMNTLQTSNQTAVVGHATSTSIIAVANTLLNKPGGYIANDMLPPFVFMDDMPAWEFGVLEMVRDLALALRDFSRSQSHLLRMNILWWLILNSISIIVIGWPSAESEYRKRLMNWKNIAWHSMTKPKAMVSFLLGQITYDWLKQIKAFRKLVTALECECWSNNF